MSKPHLDGPRAGATTNPRALVVLLHGYGADGNDLIGLAEGWQRMLPDALFIAPDAPEPCEIAPFGRQWFALRSGPERDAHAVMEGLRDGVGSAATIVDAFLDAELRAAGLDNRALGLVGFSQGAALALHVGLRRPARAVVAYSGALGRLPHPLPQPPPRVLLVHGDRDDVVPPAALFAATDALAAADVPARWHVARGVGHGIDAEGSLMGAQFLRDGFAESRPVG